MYTILIVAEEGEEIRGLRDYLSQRGYLSSLVSYGDMEEELASNEPPDLALFDLGSCPLSNGEVQHLLEESKRSASLPIIALLPQEKLQDHQFTLGTDDFILSPYNPVEVIARIRQVLGRVKGIDSKDVVRCGDLLIDLTKYEVSLSGRRVVLAFKEYELLRFLATNPGKVFTREALLNRVWGYDYFGGTRTVDVHIRRLRSKIEDRDHTFIDTVRNVGYRFRQA